MISYNHSSMYSISYQKTFTFIFISLFYLSYLIRYDAFPINSKSKFIGSYKNLFCTSLFAKNSKLTPNVEKYLKMRDLVNAQKSGSSYDELKSLSINGTTSLTVNTNNFEDNTRNTKKKSYQNLIGKKGASLDQRLRSVIAYKRENIAINTDGSLSTTSSGLTIDEEIELENMMESDDENDGDYLDSEEDDEEAIYESLVLKAIETNKLNEIKSNILISQATTATKTEKLELESNNVLFDKELNNSSTVESSVRFSKFFGSTNLNNSIHINNHTTTIISDKVLAAREDTYKPKVATWGVFDRPKDISKAYGGGRVISKAEMDRMDEENEERQKLENKENKQYLTQSMLLEKENETKIKDALNRSRNYMLMGNRKSAVVLLESVKDVISWQTDIGGQMWLELAMALETVDRSDEARNIYGKLATVCWSQKIRKQAVQLISGLDITKQIKQDVMKSSINTKPAMDEINMKLISQTLEIGLRSEWDEYKRKDTNIRPWNDNDKNKEVITWKVNTLNEAYNLLLQSFNPLKDIPSSILLLALKKFYFINYKEKIQFFQKNYPLELINLSNQDKLVNLLEKNKIKSLKIKEMQPPSINTILNPEITMPYALLNITNNNDNNENNEIDNNIIQNSKLKRHNDMILLSNKINGTWDLILSVYDKTSPISIKKYELGELRRCILLNEQICYDIYPVLFGMNTVTKQSNSILNIVDNSMIEIIMKGDSLARTPFPWQDKSKNEQVLQVLYCDDVLKITRQINDNISKPDLYLLWKRKKDTIWKKY